MVESIEVINFSNDAKPLLLVLANPEDELTSQGFAVTDVTGLVPGAATINSSELVTIDGSQFINAKLPKRTIKLTLRFIPIDYTKDGRMVHETVADIRMKSYKFFPIKEKVKLTFNKVEYRRETITSPIKEERSSYYIEGYVSKNEPVIWSKEESSSIEIVCMDPYFKSTKTQKKSFDDIYPMFHFESSIISGSPPEEGPLYSGWTDPDEDINNAVDTSLYSGASPVDEGWYELDDGDYILSEDTEIDPEKTYYHFNKPTHIISERKVHDYITMNNESYVTTGGIFTLKANSSVVRPAIFNRTTDQVMVLNMTMAKGDVIVIDTRKGYKRATLKKGFGIDIINKIDILATEWIEFQPGDNVIGYTSDVYTQRNNLNVSVEIRPLYAGI